MSTATMTAEPTARRRTRETVPWGRPSVYLVATVLIAARLGDVIMSGLWSIIWSVVEANVGIVCASLLSLKSVVVKLLPDLLTPLNAQIALPVAVVVLDVRAEMMEEPALTPTPSQGNLRVPLRRRVFWIEWVGGEVGHPEEVGSPRPYGIMADAFKSKVPVGYLRH